MYTYEFENKQNGISLGYELCNQLLNYTFPPVFLCVGESSVISDSLGAITGELLTKQYNVNAFVYGNLKQNVTNGNLKNYVEFLKQNHPNSPIVVIDSGLGSVADVGRVTLTQNAHVGGFTNQNAKTLGNLQILGMVNTTNINSLLFLKSVKLKTVLGMANFIAKSVTLAITLLNNTPQQSQRIN